MLIGNEEVLVKTENILSEVDETVKHKTAQFMEMHYKSKFFEQKNICMSNN